MHESKTNNSTAKAGRVVISSRFLKDYIGREVKVFVYLVGEGK